MKGKILLIESKRAEHPTFALGLEKKGFSIEAVPNGAAALERLVYLDPDIVVVNAASLRTSGIRICQSMRKTIPDLPIVLILEKGRSASDQNCMNVVLNLPFTVQKLINRMRPLLPAEESAVLHVGPIRLDQEQRRVRCLGKQSKLTPRLVTLLRLLMDRHGEVVERTELFQKAWETDYTEDTRTLDVHMSWLRSALEEDPRKPRFLKTIRGVGYRLDV